MSYLLWITFYLPSLLWEEATRLNPFLVLLTGLNQWVSSTAKPVQLSTGSLDCSGKKITASKPISALS